MTCHRGPAVLAVLAPARVERLLRVEATISVDTEIVAQALRQIGRATSRDAADVIAERRRAAQATASRHQERLSPPSLSDRWCVQRGDLRRNARHRARRRKRLSRGRNRTAGFDPDPADPVVLRTASPRYT